MTRLLTTGLLLVLATACGDETNEVCVDLEEWTNACGMSYPDCENRLENCTALELDNVRAYIGCLDNLSCNDDEGLATCAEDHIMDFSPQCFP